MQFINLIKYNVILTLNEVKGKDLKLSLRSLLRHCEPKALVRRSFSEGGKQSIITLTLIAFFLSNLSLINIAQANEFILPKPGAMVNLSPRFTPAHLKGISIDPNNPLKFDFIIHKGEGNLSAGEKQEEYKKLIKYFLASLAVPDENQWVNLSPYEKNRIVADDFGKTEMGRDLLAQDYILKQITSSLIYPEEGLGKEFWSKVYAQAQKQFGTTQVPVNTFNKVWILPDDALIYEQGNTAYIIKNHLRVMLEEDYLSLEKNSVIARSEATKQSKETNQIGSQIVREIILPALEKEVNEGKNFANLRQVYSGMLLATWYKRALKESFLGQAYANKSKVNGVTWRHSDPERSEGEESKGEVSPDAIYQQYLQAFKKGVFNYIKEDTDKFTNQSIPRKYFSGGAVTYAMASKYLPNKYPRGEVPTTRNAAMGSAVIRTEALVLEAATAVMDNPMQVSQKSAAMTVKVTREGNEIVLQFGAKQVRFAQENVYYSIQSIIISLIGEYTDVVVNAPNQATADILNSLITNIKELSSVKKEGGNRWSVPRGSVRGLMNLLIYIRSEVITILNSQVRDLFLQDGLQDAYITEIRSKYDGWRDVIAELNRIKIKAQDPDKVQDLIEIYLEINGGGRLEVAQRVGSSGIEGLEALVHRAQTRYPIKSINLVLTDGLRVYIHHKDTVNKIKEQIGAIMQELAHDAKVWARILEKGRWSPELSRYIRGEGPWLDLGIESSRNNNSRNVLQRFLDQKKIPIKVHSYRDSSEYLALSFEKIPEAERADVRKQVARFLQGLIIDVNSVPDVRALTEGSSAPAMVSPVINFVYDYQAEIALAGIALALLVEIYMDSKGIKSIVKGWNWKRPLGLFLRGLNFTAPTFQITPKSSPRWSFRRTAVLYASILMRSLRPSADPLRGEFNPRLVQALGERWAIAPKAPNPEGKYIINPPFWEIYPKALVHFTSRFYVDSVGVRQPVERPGWRVTGVKNNGVIQLGPKIGITADKDSVANGTSPLGGIDLNAANLNLQIKRDGKGVLLPASQQNWDNIKLDGLVPFIIEIKPFMATSLYSSLQATTTSPS